jgi:hypothetical protein
MIRAESFFCKWGSGGECEEYKKIEDLRGEVWYTERNYKK